LPVSMFHPVRFVVPALAGALLLATVDASAGQLELRDEAHLFGAGDSAQLKAAVAQSPFDARIVTTTNYVDQAAFSRYVGTLVSEPDMVVVGIDPDHHHVQVHFGTGSRIPHAAWASIERAGNDAFHQGQWEQGSEAIMRAAASSATGGGVTAPIAGAPAGQGASFMGPLVLLLIIAGVIGAVVWFARRRSVNPGSPYGAGPYGGGAPYGGPPGPYYGPGAPQGGVGPLGGGLIGAGLGGLAGYELGKMEGEREEHRRDDAFGGGRQDLGDDGGSFDAGGGGSDFGDGGGGGGFDGGDGGGGGSDF
jgi:hypothetical protein